MSEADSSSAAQATDPVDDTASASASKSPKSSTGWDGKLRVSKQATLANPEALSDPEYSDHDAPPVQQIEADEDLLEGEDPDVEVCADR
jgi:protein phosphatase 1 regulatory subunit 7